MRGENASCAAGIPLPRRRSNSKRHSLWLAVLCCSATAASAATTTITEPFNTGLGRFTTQVRNAANGDNFGFSNTDNTGTGGGGSAAGELGGVFARTPEGTPAYVADTAIGVLTNTDDLSCSGKFIVTANNGFNGGFLAGYIN